MSHLDRLMERRCACGCTRRNFITHLSLATGAMALMPSAATAAFSAPLPARKKQGAVVRAAFICTPSRRMAEDPNGWWSWPGTDYDAEGHQTKYSAALGEMEKKLGMKILVEPKPIENAEGAQQFLNAVSADRPDGVLLVLLHNFALAHADTILQTVEKAGVPAVFYIGLGVKHGPVGHYRRPGRYFIQSLDNLDAIEYGMRMIHTNEGSTAVQVFWKPGDPVTMMHYYAGSKPTLDVYSGKVVKSHEMPPAGGCATNVEIEITDCPDVCMVKGHHNLLFCGDHARKFAHFARLYRMQLKEGEKTLYEDPV